MKTESARKLFCNIVPDWAVLVEDKITTLPKAEYLEWLDALEAAYLDWKQRDGQQVRQATRDKILKYDTKTVYDKFWRPVLADVPPALDYEEAGAAVGPKLMLGSGENKTAGFLHHDRAKLWPHIDVAHDLNEFPWPWEDNSFGYIEMSDVLEHLRADMVAVMDELHRILRPGGYLYIHTAEAGSWQLAMDPTHVVGFRPESLDYFDPERSYGEVYCYSERGWRVVRRTSDAGGLLFILQPRKVAVAVEVPA